MGSAALKADAKTTRKILVAVSYYFSQEVWYLQNLKYNTKQACIFNLILVFIPFNQILSIKNKG